MAKILIVEDNLSLNKAYKDKFTSSGFDVDIAIDGDEAIAALKRRPLPNLIILDLIIPKRDGYQVLEDVKASRVWKKIPVVIASNLGEETNMEKAKRMGAVDYFVKSDVTLEDLVHKIKTILQK